MLFVMSVAGPCLKKPSWGMMEQSKMNKSAAGKPGPLVVAPVCPAKIRDGSTRQGVSETLCI
jgi:hypothetical protein